jgi:PhnB protein
MGIMTVDATAAPGPKRSITPRIVVHDVEGCAAFLKSTFGAEGEVFVDRPTDTDATYQRALNAGAEVIETPSDQFYGDRRAMVKDSYGNVYQIATRIHS